MPHQVLADVVLALHLGVVLFVIGGLAAIFLGNAFGWLWVNLLWFRVLHLGAIAVVVAESWFDIVCPLTTLESWLRAQAGQDSYSRSFIEHWVKRVLFYEASSWVFAVVYTAFGLLVAAAWWYFPPNRTGRSSKSGA